LTYVKETKADGDVNGYISLFSHEKANLCMLNPHRKKCGWAKTTERQQELFKLLHHLAH
jgi:hypothetical protein